MSNMRKSCPECGGTPIGWHMLDCSRGRGPELLNTSAPPFSLEPRSKHEPPLAGPPTPPVRQIGNMFVVELDEVPPQWADQVVAPTYADLQAEQQSYDAHQSAGEAGYYDPPAIPTDEQMKRAHDGVEPWCDTDAEWDAWLADHDRRVNAEATSWRIRAESAEAALDRLEQER